MERFGMKEDETIESPFISKTIERSQEKVEKQNFEIRRHLLEYDDVLNQQRIVIYDYRRSILEGEDEIYGFVRDLIRESVHDMIKEFSPARTVSPEAFENILKPLSTMTGISVDDLKKEGFTTSSSENLETDIINFLLMNI